MKKNTNIISIVAAILLSVVVQAQTIIPNGATAPQLPLPAVPAAYDANKKVNFVRTWEARKAITDASQQSLDNNVNFKTASAYFDGLGRPLQTIVKGNNYDGTKDIVSMNQYDEFGRETKQYLPYAPASGSNGKFRLNPFAEQQAYYNTSYQDQTPFSKTEIETSPLNRPIKSFAQGNSWAGDNKGIEQQFTVNTPDEEVRMATIGYTPGDVPGFGNIYPAGDLIKSVAIDEHGKKVVEYKTKNGLVILKKVQLSNTPGVSYAGWLSTVYIYDDFSRLRYVVQPKGVEWLVQNGWNFSMPGGTEVVNELCFIYEYDAEGRMFYKKVPGAGHTYMCYDKWDRLVFVQDAKLRSQGQWMVTWYDDLNRPTNTALYNVAQTPAQMQSYLDALTPVNPVPVFDEYYLTRLSNTYYDEYSISGTAAFNQAMVNTAQANIITGDETPDVLNKTDLTRGMVTSAETKVLGTTTFLKTTIYYDTKARAIQTYSTNYRGGTDVTTSVYSYTGKPLSNYLAHNNPSATLYGTQNITVFTRNVYNNDYLLKTEKKIMRVGENSAETPWQRIGEMEYDDMGKPKKKLMGAPASNFFVNTDYNVRGWLTGINKTAHQNLENGNVSPGAFYDAIFSEVLHYDYGYNKQYHNGNIAGIKWANAADKQARSYGYEYDNMNRLKKADFTQKAGTVWDISVGIDYSLTNMSYDANGNILNLAQKALKLNTSSEVDNLIYGYLPNSNKLARVTETAPGSTLPGTPAGLGDFKDGTNTGDDYSYDINGSMVQDNNKNIASIAYNHLNLPVNISVTGKGTIYYTYDASGNKLMKKVRDGDKISETIYIGGFVYQRSYIENTGPGLPPPSIGDTLQFASHEEGRIRYAKKYFYTGDSAYQWHYDFFYKDHLGNIRAVVTEQRDTAKYMATFETPVRTTEKALFHKIEETAVLSTSVSSYPGPGEYTSKLNGIDKRVGASTTLKVMAGDRVDLGVHYWYPEYTETRGRGEQRYEDLLGSLVSFLSGDASVLSSGKASNSELSAPTVLPAAIQDFFTTQGGEPVTAGRPNAYLNWILLDEQFKFVPEGSGFLRVGTFAHDMQTLGQLGLQMPKSGYLYVYLSNQTIGANVYFDNLTVQHYTGPLSETTDYTPWGLDMKMLGSKAFGKLENKKKYNGYEKNETFDLNLYESFYRAHDPQLGRFWQIDPKPTFNESLYSAMGNNPILYCDVLGDSIINPWQFSQISKALASLYQIKMGKEILDNYYNNSNEHIVLDIVDLKSSNAIFQTLNISIDLSINKKGEIKRSTIQTNSEGVKAILDATSDYKLPTKGKTVSLIAINMYNNQNLQLDRYDLMFALYHELNAHVKNRIAGESSQNSPDQEHSKFGNKVYSNGMGLFSNGVQVVTYGTDSWKVFKEVLNQKIKDKMATNVNLKDYQYILDTESAQAKKNKK